MKQGLRLGKVELFWLKGGKFALDGGAMFGAVPKALMRLIRPEKEVRDE